jgi:hypothetical protein
MSWNMDGSNEGAYDDIRAWEKDKKDRDEKIESQEFYDLMQKYRHAPISNQKEVLLAFEEVKKFIRGLP